MMLSSCSDATRELKITTVPTELAQPDDKPNLPDPEPIQIYSIKWLVVTKDNLPTGDNWVLYGITPQDYKNLSLILADTSRWAKESMWRINYYKGVKDAQ